MYQSSDFTWHPYRDKEWESTNKTGELKREGVNEIKHSSLYYEVDGVIF